MDLKLQRAAVWCGVVALASFGLFFCLIAGLIPPLSPTSSAEHIASTLVANKLRIRIGLAFCMYFVAWFMPFLAAICLRLRQIEGKWGVLSITQIFSGVVVVPGFIFPMMILATATFRPGQRPVEITQTLDDVFWLMFVGIVGTLVVQAAVLAIAAFIDQQNPPVFPRWFGYLNIWYLVLATPGGAVMLFNDGPLAWNGVFAFWIPLVAFSVWIVALVVVMLRSISAQQTAEREVIAA
ncbi:hypothetical protein A5709_13255 [Mycobacterium sp. E1386]|uniref:hypothetical protein n=1 Tax=Mycobacterium sp. E1386 TaxID=1834126 RepID=UPI0007FD2359|nr:hypothetical protein [Mycobacterium sp. E1386]OBI38168.1 hypothetical protein A5709_13255 [Mycobacterium sp. E1386]